MVQGSVWVVKPLGYRHISKGINQKKLEFCHQKYCVKFIRQAEQKLDISLLGSTSSLASPSHFSAAPHSPLVCSPTLPISIDISSPIPSSTSQWHQKEVSIIKWYKNKITVNGELTFYAAGDNCPPSAEIAYPTTSIPQAGGLGTYANPITCASSSSWLPVHSIVYIPVYKKYFIMADSCEECENEWNDDGHYHIDAWLGPQTISVGTTNCEVELSLSNTQFIINPVSTYTVITTPFFQNGTCIRAISDPCVDEGNECGNTCQLPSAMSCQAAADLFSLTLTRFKALNPTLSCTSNIAKGKTVCMSGSCGGP